MRAGGALSAIETDAFGLVITDYHLVWTTGLAVLHAVRARWPDIPVIMVTGANSEDLAIKGMKAGLADYVPKSSPHYLGRLAAAVRRAFDEAGRV